MCLCVCPHIIYIWIHTRTHAYTNVSYNRTLVVHETVITHTHTNKLTETHPYTHRHTQTHTDTSTPEVASGKRRGGRRKKAC